MNKITERWSPVIAKCKELPQEQWDNFAAILENQYNAEIGLSKENLLNYQKAALGETSYALVNFTRFVLPIVRKVWPLLIEAGVKIKPVDNTKDTILSKVGPTINNWDKYMQDNSIDLDCRNMIDAEENISDHLAKKIAESIIDITGSAKEYWPYLIVAPFRADEFIAPVEGFKMAPSAFYSRHLPVPVISLPDSIHNDNRVVE